MKYVRARVAFVSASLLLSVAGCAASSNGDAAEGTTGSTATEGTDDVSEDTAATETGETVDPNAPKFYDDVLPLLVQNCSSCHTADGIGPFDLEDYETAKGLAEAIEIATHTRSMPPFNADNSGACNTYKDARWLEDDELALITEWIEGGKQEGDSSLALPERPELPPLAGGDVVELETAAGYVPVADQSGPIDDYQCFLGEINNGDVPLYITGYEVLPGNPKVTHHMVGFLVDLDGDSASLGTNRALIQLLDEASPDQPGWDCFGAAGNGVAVEGTPVTWAPGGGAFNFPEGTGIRVDPGYGLVMQTHYNLANGTGEDTTKVRLAVSEEVEREAVNALFDQFLFSGLSGGNAEIPPGEEAFVYSWTQQIGNFDSRINQWEKVEIFGALPHMHELGSRMQVSYFEGGEETCGMYLDRWDFQWQQAFMYDEPFILSPSDSIKVACEWNSEGLTSPTLPGLGTQQEMCLYGIYAAEAK